MIRISTKTRGTGLSNYGAKSRLSKPGFPDVIATIASSLIAPAVFGSIQEDFNEPVSFRDLRPHNPTIGSTVRTAGRGVNRMGRRGCQEVDGGVGAAF